MKCLYCNADNSKVIDSRIVSEGHAIRRRRECPKCGKRFTTYERVEEMVITVVKKNGTREDFDKNKVLRGLLRATEKRDISRDKLEELIIEIEKDIYNNLKGEIKSKKIGKLIMKNLRKLDEVAYVRFASVYNEFDSLENFIKEIDKIKKEG
ncbi:transcriptional regulator NrdR [Haliovirga abyssi]|uniref:Transcriptional repressor NrdR n=1 Tax=Haliovirga abyssi TaxID=2996794 RepID=A0AAU9DDS3_9FUSO|nr:transcriptional regulator NrdR [Haliovirga abyssi]BDU50492.1 transcriptional repressor NrdR [Haliovirga abyssi]